jgi:hypothetical protein
MRAEEQYFFLGRHLFILMSALEVASIHNLRLDCRA